MGAPAAQFENRNFFLPGAYGGFRAVNQELPAAEDLQTLLLIGPADNGANVNDTSLSDGERFYTFSDFRSARSVLQSGPLLDAINLAFAPSTDERFSSGPQVIHALNINPNVAANRSLPTEAGSDTILQATVPGVAGNRIRICKTADKTLKIGNESSEIERRDVGFEICNFAYVGDATSANLEISAAGVTVTLAGQTDGSTDLTISWDEATTLGELVRRVNAASGYVAEPVFDLNFDVQKLDHVLAADSIDLIAGPQLLRADAYAEELALEGTELVNVTVGAQRRPLAQTGGYLYLQGGAKGVPAADAYRLATEFSERLDGLYAVTLTTNLADQLHFRDSVNRMNDVDGGSRKRFGGCGSAGTTPFADRLKNARVIASRYICYGGSPFEMFDSAGLRKTFAPNMLAVLNLGTKAAASPRQSPTHKPLNILNTTETLSQDQQIAAVRAGMLVLGRITRAGRKPLAIIRSVTTEAVANTIYNEAASVCAGLTMVKELIEGFAENFVGEVPADISATQAEGPTEATMQSWFEGRMDSFVDRGFFIGSLSIGRPPWRKGEYKLRWNGDTVYFEDLQGKVAQPLNFVFFMLELDSLRGVAAGGAA